MSAHNDHYPLAQDGTVEPDRLHLQYIATKRAFEWKQPYPDLLDASSVTHVLDLAAGSCIWTLDFAAHPAIKPRLRVKSTEEQPDAINLYACDITASKFPSKDVLDAIGCHAFEHDLTKPFPEEMRGKFDFVHLSLVVLALRPAEWELALQNIRSLLKPGGMLWDIENDPVLHPTSEPFSHATEHGHDVPACMDGNTWLHKYNSVFVRTVLKNGTYYDLSFRMPALLNEAGLALKYSAKAMGAFGKASDAWPSLHSETAHTAANADALHAVMANAAFAAGELEAPTGRKITTEEEKATLAEEMARGVREEGGYIILHEYVSVKE